MTTSRDISNRKIGAIVGSLVADAASMPLHWIYDRDKIKALVADRPDRPEFFDPPSCPFYTYEQGRNSPYGEQALHLLQVVAESDKLDPVEYAEKANAYFSGPYTGRLDHSTKGFLANVKEGKTWPTCGADDDQANSIAKMVSVVALYAGKPELLARVEDATRVTQNTDKAVAMALAGARILERLILGATAHDAIAATVKDLRDEARVQPTPVDGVVADKIEEALRLVDQPHFDAVKTIGLSCAFPFALQNGVHILSQTTSYESAVRQTILAGGDNCSRVLFIGACLGALNGLDGVPSAWLAQTNEGATVHRLAQKLAGVTNL